MVAQYAFFVNSDACSGCKTCQVACKDRSDLPAGTRWRRVYEVTSGGWQLKGGAWISGVFAYNLSVSCNHCIDPPCAAACSPQALWKRNDGVVLFDSDRCTRCGSCLPACPYGAIRPDSVYGVSKCDFCPEELDAGRPPLCVAACPNRALDFGDFEELRGKYQGVSRVFPLPDAAAFKPALLIRPHRNAAFAESGSPVIANLEEI
jgi:anaerobic dimethyl sulfoxide reductase subunit B (iron-sulfur subunit)